MTKKSKALVPSLNRGPTAAQRKEQSMRDKMLAALQRLPRGTFAKGGGMVGGMIAGPKGAAVGTAIGSGISTITGFGDYVVKSNSIMKTGYASELEKSPVDDLPQFTRGAHTVNVKHREYFGDLLVPAEPAQFNNVAYIIQPSNAALFPWLARIARQYQQYKIRGMVVEFKSNTTDYAAAGPLGSVGIATNYNVVDAKFDTLVEFQNSEFAVVSKPSRNILHAIECSPAIGRGEWLYVRDTHNENQNMTQDSRFNDFGLLQVCTSGLPGTAGQTLGQMWVSYDIEFAKPILGSEDPGPVFQPCVAITSTPDTDALVPTADSQVLSRTWTCNTIVPATSTAYRVFETTQVQSSTGNISAGIATVSGNYINLYKPGKYTIWFRMNLTNSSGSNGLLASWTTNSNVQPVVNFGSGAGTFTNWLPTAVPHGGVYGANLTWSYASCIIVEVTSPNGSGAITVAPPSFTTTTTSLVGVIERQAIVEFLAVDAVNYVP